MDETLVYIVDDDISMAESLAWVIGSIGLQTKLFTQAETFLKEHNPAKPGCILIDVRMPKISGPEIQVELNSKREAGMPIQPIIFMSGYADIPLTVKVMRFGALNFLTKPFNHQVLLDTINEALRIDSDNRIKYETKKEISRKFSILSARELQILMGILNGKPNKSISTSLNISTKTVEAHRASLIKKMKVKSLSELIKIALSNDFTKN